ncbi:PilW family protein [Dyella sp.]|uniref:PilW family protein n=1 Tax=Dyella sp. TaxID=1869338 RepID=UPI002ED55643
MTMTVRRGERGLSLIEVLIVLALGVMLGLVMVNLFLTLAAHNRVQRQLSRLQEEGRYAVSQLGRELAQANAQYCNNTGGNASVQSNGIYIDALRAPRVLSRELARSLGGMDLTTIPGAGGYPGDPGTAYALPAFLSMRGYACALGGCKPVDPSTGTSLPGMGKNVGNRVPGSDVLTVRHIDSNQGWAVGSTTRVQPDLTFPQRIKSITINPALNEPVNNFEPGDLAYLADCTEGQIFSVAVNGSELVPTGANYTPPQVDAEATAPRLFNFSRDFRTVTYYLGIVDDGQAGKTGALFKQVNGNDPNRAGSRSELIRGIERMNFLFAVEDTQGNTRYMTADEVDNATSCPRVARGVTAPIPNHEPGCLWRAIKAIQVNMLLSGQIPVPALSTPELAYVYEPDALDGPKPPDDHPIRPTDQGFAEKLIRREFTTVISLRNFNP